MKNHLQKSKTRTFNRTYLHTKKNKNFLEKIYRKYLSFYINNV